MSFRRSSDKIYQGGTADFVVSAQSNDFSDYADKKMRINLWHYKIYFIIQTGGIEYKERGIFSVSMWSKLWHKPSTISLKIVHFQAVFRFVKGLWRLVLHCVSVRMNYVQRLKIGFWLGWNLAILYQWLEVSIWIRSQPVSRWTPCKPRDFIRRLRQLNVHFL